MTSSYSLYKLQSFNGEGYNLWKYKMKFIIEGMNCGIWKALKEGPFVPTHKVDVSIVNKKIGSKMIRKICSLVWRQKLSSPLLLVLMSLLLRDCKRNIGHSLNYPWRDYWGKKRQGKVVHINPQVWTFS